MVCTHVFKGCSIDPQTIGWYMVWDCLKLVSCLNAFFKNMVSLEKKPHFSTCLKQLKVSFATIFF
jgi:hypothetical protein